MALEDYYWVASAPKELEKHVGKWIAVKNKKVVVSAKYFKVFLRKVREKGEISDFLIFQVPKITADDLIW